MVFRVPKIKTFCFCASLETGSYVVAGLSLLWFLGALSLALFFTSHPATVHQVLLYDTVFMNIGVFSLVFLIGIIKKDHTLIFPWVLLLAIFTAFLLNYLLNSLLYLGLMDTRPEEMTVEVVGVVTVGYASLVAYNHYRNLVEARTEEIN